MDKSDIYLIMIFLLGASCYFWGGWTSVLIYIMAFSFGIFVCDYRFESDLEQILNHNCNCNCDRYYYHFIKTMDEKITKLQSYIDDHVNKS